MLSDSVGLIDSFWNENLWLGNGTKWADVTNGPDKKILYPDSSDYLYQILLVFIFIIGRYGLERYCFVPVGQQMGVKQKKLRHVQDIPLLQSAYRKSRDKKDVAALAKQLDMSERQVERWWRHRRNADKPSKLTKFCEHAWKATYCGFNGAIGIYILWDKNYFWDLDKCIIGYPHFGLTSDVWWFYMINCAYIYSSFVTVFIEVRRKDFVQMVVHHVVTSALLAATWIASWYRVTVVLVSLLDTSECLVEVAKALKTAKYERTCTFVFYVFTLVWFYVRIYFLPFQIFYRTSMLKRKWMEPFAMSYILNYLLLFIIILQVYWTALIVQVAYKSIVVGGARDLRSSSSELSEWQHSGDEDGKRINNADNDPRNHSKLNEINGKSDNYKISSSIRAKVISDNAKY